MRAPRTTNVTSSRPSGELGGVSLILLELPIPQRGIRTFPQPATPSDGTQRVQDPAVSPATYESEQNYRFHHNFTADTVAP